MALALRGAHFAFNEGAWREMNFLVEEKKKSNLKSEFKMKGGGLCTHTHMYKKKMHKIINLDIGFLSKQTFSSPSTKQTFLLLFPLLSSS